jgi:hypothetical protein
VDLYLLKARVHKKRSKTTLETSGKDAKNTLETSGKDAKNTLETSGKDARSIELSLYVENAEKARQMDFADRYMLVFHSFRV